MSWYHLGGSRRVLANTMKQTGQSEAAALEAHLASRQSLVRREESRLKTIWAQVLLPRSPATSTLPFRCSRACTFLPMAPSCSLLQWSLARGRRMAGPPTGDYCKQQVRPWRAKGRHSVEGVRMLLDKIWSACCCRTSQHPKAFRLFCTHVGCLIFNMKIAKDEERVGRSH
jgi:hypothetical protein